MCSNQQGAERELDRRGNAARRGRDPQGIVLVAELARQERRVHVRQRPRCQPENINDAKDPVWGAPLPATGRLTETLAGAFSHHMQLEVHREPPLA